MSPNIGKSQRLYSLDDLYLMVTSIYGEQNADRSPTATFAHFVEVCGMLTAHDRQKRREESDFEGALCRALGWFFPLLAKFKVSSVERLVYRKYPYACPYCRECPHNDRVCKTTQGTGRTVDHDALKRKYVENLGRLPGNLNAWQQMFEDIYRRESSSVGSGRSSIALLEELGELAEAVRVYDRHPKYFAGEAADVFSYLMGFANEYSSKLQIQDDSQFDFQASFLRRYPGLCPSVVTSKPAIGGRVKTGQWEAVRD